MQGTLSVISLSGKNKKVCQSLHFSKKTDYMTSWRKFKKQYKKDMIKRTYGHLVTLKDKDGNVYSGTFKAVKPYLETGPNGRKRVAWACVVDDMAKEVAEKAVEKADTEIIEDKGSVAINFTVKSDDISDTLKELFGL